MYADKYNVTVQHKHYHKLTGILSGAEHRIVEYDTNGTRVDGFVAEQKLVIEFHGDYFHGNKNIYDPDDINCKVGETFGSLYAKTMARMDKLVKLGYKVIYVWERDFRDWRKGGMFAAMPIHVHSIDRRNETSK